MGSLYAIERGLFPIVFRRISAGNGVGIRPRNGDEYLGSGQLDRVDEVIPISDRNCLVHRFLAANAEQSLYSAAGGDSAPDP